MSENLNTVSSILSQTSTCFLATICGHSPKVRPFQFQFEEGGKLWFCTSRSKEVYAQLQANPEVQICAVTKDVTTLRVDATVRFEDNAAVKAKIIDTQPLIKRLYGSAENPDFVVFAIEHGSYVIFDFSGNPPRKGQF